MNLKFPQRLDLMMFAYLQSGYMEFTWIWSLKHFCCCCSSMHDNGLSWFWQLCNPFFPLCNYLKLSYFKLPEETKKENQFFNLCLLCPFLSPELQRWCLFVCQFGQGWRRRRRRWWWSSQKVEDLVELRVSLSELLVFFFVEKPLLSFSSNIIFQNPWGIPWSGATRL